MSTKYGVKELEAEFGKLTFGRALRSHRLGEEMSQTALAKALGISRQSLNDLESGRVLPSIHRSSEVAKVVGLPEAVLIELAIQDHLNREKIDLVVKIEGGKKTKRAS